jgi:glycosyltransferase involved in cell wall biosynthesis
MVGSAPWNLAQFQQKGIDALLTVAQRASHLDLVFLWRGVLADEIRRRVRRLGIENQVEILDRKVDVNEILSYVHASIALATHPAIIRPYPHSLLESLAAGKPVLLSKTIPMADYVQRMGCGKVVKTLNPTNILAAIESLAHEYKSLQIAAQQVGQRDFAQHNMLTSFGKVYEYALDRSKQS